MGVVAYSGLAVLLGLDRRAYHSLEVSSHPRHPGMASSDNWLRRRQVSSPNIIPTIGGIGLPC